MAEYNTTDNPPFIDYFFDFEGDLVKETVDTNDPVLNSLSWWGLDDVGDQFTSPEFMPRDPPKPDVNPLQDSVPVFEEFPMDIDQNLAIETGCDASTTPEQANGLTEPLDPELPVPNEDRLDDGMIVDDVSKETRPRLDQSQVDILNNWVADCPTPYPTRKEKLNLSKRTGLKISQISSWFSRARQKLFRKSLSDLAPAVSSPPVLAPTLLSPVLAAAPPPKVYIETEIPLSAFDHECFRQSKLSLPIELEKASRSNSTIQRCRSLPSCFRLDHLQRPSGYPATGWSMGASLDVVLSSHTENCSSNSQKAFLGGLDLSLSRTTNYLQNQDHLKRSYINEWLRGLPISTIEMTIPQQNQVDSGSIHDIPSDIFGILLPHCNSSSGLQNRGEYDADDGLDSSSVAWSAAWSASFSASSAGSYRTLGSRKGRRIFVHPNSSNASGFSRKRGLDVEAAEGRHVDKKSRATPPSCDPPPDLPPPKKYHCTFCGASFSRPFLWKRHEESAHAPQRKWICGSYFESDNCMIYPLKCPLCGKRREQSIAIQDICPHTFDDCWAKPEADRTFFRKDAFGQHLKTVHASTEDDLQLLRYRNLDDWSHDVDTSGYDLRCHFCGAKNHDWDARCKHILQHFDDGMTMNFWKPFLTQYMDQLKLVSPPPSWCTARCATIRWTFPPSRVRV
ncbi:hypothetical protein F5Y03DRAFT_258865 [Xylaria venustula]|nr:hypothetical protein F5Y03DRAFT_258865 [Xylaria venustula]